LSEDERISKTKRKRSFILYLLAKVIFFDEMNT